MASCLPLVVSCLASCLSDEGNYDYTQLDDVDIQGVPESARFILQTPQAITPTISTSIDENNL